MQTFEMHSPIIAFVVADFVVAFVVGVVSTGGPAVVVVVDVDVSGVVGAVDNFVDATVVVDVEVVGVVVNVVGVDEATMKYYRHISIDCISKHIQSTKYSRKLWHASRSRHQISMAFTTEWVR